MNKHLEAQLELAQQAYYELQLEKGELNSRHQDTLDQAFACGFKSGAAEVMKQVKELERKLEVAMDALTSLTLNENNLYRLSKANIHALEACVLSADAIARQALKELEK